jgi:hypothetical protein
VVSRDRATRVALEIVGQRLVPPRCLAFKKLLTADYSDNTDGQEEGCLTTRVLHSLSVLSAQSAVKFFSYVPSSRNQLVKINLHPARTRTVARIMEIVRTGKRRLPKCEPSVPAITAATARIHAKFGTGRPLETYPTRPATELTRMNKAETAAARRIDAQRQNRSSGVRKIPPPVPVRPERNPMPAPIPIEAGTDGGVVFGGSPCRKNKRAAENRSTAPISILRIAAGRGS